MRNSGVNEIPIQALRTVFMTESVMYWKFQMYWLFLPVLFRVGTRELVGEPITVNPNYS
jgi:hypothetical protein